MNETIKSCRRLLSIINVRIESVDIKELGVHQCEKEFYHSIVFRLYHALNSSLVLLNDLSNNPFGKFSYCLVARTMMMDSIIFMRVAFDRDNKERTKKVLKEVYDDHKHYYLRMARLFAKMDGQDKTEDEIREKLLKNINSKSPKSLNSTFTSLVTRMSGEDRKSLIDVFEHYDIFSKLAHFGEISMDLMIEQVTDCKGKAGNLMIKKNIELVILVLITAFNKLVNHELLVDDIIEEYKKLMDIKVCS